MPALDYSLFIRLCWDMLTDEQAKEIEDSRQAGMTGPVCARWVDELLEDRRQRIDRQEYVRKRLRDAFTYLEKLLNRASEPLPGERPNRSGKLR